MFELITGYMFYMVNPQWKKTKDICLVHLISASSFKAVHLLEVKVSNLVFHFVGISLQIGSVVTPALFLCCLSFGLVWHPSFIDCAHSFLWVF